MEQVRPCASLGVFAGIRSTEQQVRPLGNPTEQHLVQGVLNGRREF